MSDSLRRLFLVVVRTAVLLGAIAATAFLVKRAQDQAQPPAADPAPAPEFFVLDANGKPVDVSTLSLQPLVSETDPAFLYSSKAGPPIPAPIGGAPPFLPTSKSLSPDALKSLKRGSEPAPVFPAVEDPKANGADG